MTNKNVSAKNNYISQKLSLLTTILKNWFSTDIKSVKPNRAQNNAYPKIRKPKQRFLSAVDNENQKFSFGVIKQKRDNSKPTFNLLSPSILDLDRQTHAKDI